MNVPLSFAWHLLNKSITVTPHNSTNHILHTAMFFCHPYRWWKTATWRTAKKMLEYH